MADHIPFINSREDCKVFKKLYADSTMVRLSLETQDKVLGALPPGTQIWLDPAIDGIHNVATSATQQYLNHIKRFPGYEKIADPAFQATPDDVVVKTFVSSVMGECAKGSHTPQWITVPQLPVISNSSRNKINRKLAQSAGEWRVKQRFGGKLILPVVFTHQEQIKLKTSRKAPLTLAQACYRLASADGVWVVDSTMLDQEGSRPLDRRFAGLIQFHQELVDSLPSESITIAGPYWGMNLILWARGLVRYAAIGLGNAYRYYIPGGRLMRGKDHFALAPLRRWAIASPQFKAWLKRGLEKIPRQESAYGELEALYRSYDQRLYDWRSQVGEVYKKWFNELNAVPESGRALALFQQFSSAYVLGKNLPELPRNEGTARKPDRVAQQLMMHCL